ncbi:MAG TPA: RNA polymerase sigma factor [Candidatus Woesebacteria bacterium]|nr:RNA polymerase sigma factor [Candidatus Woesebacteria bacterium]HNS95078.1 RNA polymerase sigma factor [Candidatus Woesebacteria bacterium]
MNETISTLGHDKENLNKLPSFEEIYINYYQKIRAYLYTLTHHMALADDLTQEVFLNIYRILTQPERAHVRPDESKLEAWIYTCARNIFYDYARRKNTKKMDEAESVEVLVEADADQPRSSLSDNPLHLAVHSERDHDLSEAIMSLDDLHRAVIICRHVDGMSIPETANHLGIPAGTVKSREHRGIKKLGQWYKQHNATALLDDYLV